VGLGHAGSEASIVSAKLGLSVLCVSSNLDRVCWPSCNPAIGGPGKSQLVSELDAMGGEMAKNADKTYTQIKILNSSRGPAVWARRAQIDKIEYSYEMKRTLESFSNIDLLNAEATDLIISEEKSERRVIGVRVDYGLEFFSNAVVLTTGTFLNGRIITGEWEKDSGRLGDFPSKGITNSLVSLGLKVGRLKTGTPPRIDRKSVDFSQTEVAPGSKKPLWLSFKNEWENRGLSSFKREQLNCYLIYTNEETHNVIRSNLNRLPLFNGRIKSIGPRYCPSFESKVINFKDKERHPLFLEPEGRHTDELYIQGANTSVPVDVQEKFLKTIPALKDVKIIRFGYAVEYDFVFPYQLSSTLELKNVKGLFLAGQINGTTGYEEAAVQGFVAGLNASLIYTKKKEPVIFRRNESFIGVLIDDLVTQEYKEPYRIFTARSEFRLSLRETNSTTRLSKISYNLGILSREEFEIVQKKESLIEEKQELIKSFFVDVDGEKVSLEKKVKQGNTLKKLEEISGLNLETGVYSVDVESFVRVYYEGYLKKEKEDSERMKEIDSIKIPKDFDYDSVPSIRNEARERLKEFKPENLGQASRIAGVMSSDISILMIYLKKFKTKT